jgi:hypothetical protein
MGIMSNQQPLWRKIVKVLASLKLAVLVLLSLATVIATGTFVEARYDAFAAAEKVYHTPWMYGVLTLLVINLTAVMVDRWPWKKRHTPFVMAHIGIIVLLLGALITVRYGLDGTMRFQVGEANRYVTVQDTEFQVWSSFDGEHYIKLLDKQTDFFKNSPRKKPVSVSLPEGPLSVEDYKPYVIPSHNVVASESPRAGSAVRFQIKNDRVDVTDWLLQSRKDADAENNFGPAQLTLGKAPEASRGKNEIFLTPDGSSLKYVVYYKDGRPAKRGRAKEGQAIDTGWMGLQFTVLRYLPQAEDAWEFKDVDRPTPLTTSAIRIHFEGKDHWLQQNDVMKFFTTNAVYIVTYGSRRIDLGFDLKLIKFHIGHYQGTTRASSYSSVVATPDGKEHLIAMNEPLKYKRLTFYQASFQQDTDGTPTASILSVNYDPGRWIKYLGSLIISLGIVGLFYNKRKAARASAPASGTALQNTEK